MLYIRSRKIVLLTLVLSTAMQLTAQRELNMPDFENKLWYYGITFSYNRTSFNATLSPTFLARDSVNYVEPFKTGGFSMGFTATYKLTNRLELRYNPQLVFAEKSIEYDLQYPQSVIDETKIMKKKIESILVSNPVHILLNSDRINNFSFYAFVGGKLDYDLASNARKRNAENIIKIDSKDWGVEAGVGFRFYFKSVIFTPEIKISNGTRNVHFRDEDLKFSNVVDQLRSRMFVFSLHLQG
jgi:hypothetical protein